MTGSVEAWSSPSSAGADGEQVAAGEGEDFALVAEGGAHDLGLVAEFLVVVVDRADRLDAGILLALIVLAGGCLVPVEDAADEGRDELHAGFGAGNGLGEGEQQGEVAVDAFLFEHFGGLDAFPGGGDLDEDAVAGVAFLFVGGDELARLGDGALGVERKAGVHFGGDAAGDDLEDFQAEEDQDAVENRLGECRAGRGRRP